MLIENTQIRSCSEAELNYIETLIAQAMREDSSHRDNEIPISKEYPSVFSPKNQNNIWALYEENQIVSALAAYPYNIQIGNIILNIIGIGSVATDIRYRKKGYSSKLHKMVLNYYLENTNYECAILWTNLFDYYRKIGYENMGKEIIYLLESPLPEENCTVTIEPYRNAFLEDIINLYSKHKNCVIRSKETFTQLLSIPDMEILCATLNSKCIAYTIRGKGSDFNATIHEWAGNEAAIIKLLNRNLVNEQDKIFIISPANHPIDKKIGPFTSKHEGYMCMMNIINPQLLLNKLGLSITGSNTDNVIKIQNKGKIVSLEIKELPSLLFETYLSEKNEILVKELSRKLPLSFFVWGLDSV